METQTFGGRLRQLRIEAGLTQPELAFGITSVSHVSLIESNKRQPSDEIVLKLPESTAKCLCFHGLTIALDGDLLI